MSTICTGPISNTHSHKDPANCVTRLSYAVRRNVEATGSCRHAKPMDQKTLANTENVISFAGDLFSGISNYMGYKNIDI